MLVRRRARDAVQLRLELRHELRALGVHLLLRFERAAGEVDRKLAGVVAVLGRAAGPQQRPDAAAVLALALAPVHRQVQCVAAILRHFELSAAELPLLQLDLWNYRTPFTDVSGT